MNHDTVGVETLNLDRFEFTAAGEYTLTLKVRRSPTNNKPGAGNEGAVIGSKVELKIYSVIFARTAESFATPDDKTGDITTSNVTGATMIGDGATLTFRNVSLHENATYALRILGRVSGGTVVKITYTGAGNILESDYFYDMLFTVTEVSEIPAGNTTVYEYNTRTGRYDLATAYNADTVYYLKTGEVTASPGTVTFTATENITATQWISLGNLNLLADTYTITVTVEDGSLVVDDMVLVRTADYLRTIELDRSAISTTEANEVRTAILSDNHYVYGEIGGIGDLDRQNLLSDLLRAEYTTAESLDAAVLAGVVHDRDCEVIPRCDTLVGEMKYARMPLLGCDDGVDGCSQVVGICRRADLVAYDAYLLLLVAESTHGLHEIVAPFGVEP